MHTALSKIDHRPWPIPAQRWSWRQSWRDLLFAHWPVPAATLRSLVPAGLEAARRFFFLPVDGAPLLHFARRLDVVVWNGERLT